MEIKPQKPDVSVEDISIVLVGAFNPSIYHPMWFALQGLIRETEAEAAKIEIIHPDVASFSIEWLTVQVLRDRFTASIKAEVYHKHLNDFAQGVFLKLAHTPIWQMGFNFTSRIHFKSEEDWHAFGHFIAPKSPWAGVLSSPGMRGFQMQSLRPSGGNPEKPGCIVLSVEADLLNCGDALVRINDHYEVPVSSEGERSKGGASWAVELLKDDFFESLKYARVTTQNLVDKFLSSRTVDAG